MTQRNKRNGFYPLSNGQIQYKFYFQGQRLSVCGSTEKECRERADERRIKLIAEAKQATANAEAKKNPKLCDYFTEYENTRRGLAEVKESTLYTDRCRFDSYIKPYLGDVKLKDLNRQLIDEMRVALKEDLKASTINGVVEILHKVLRQAVIDQLISSNPCDSLKRLRSDNPRAKDTIHRALTDDELKKLFNIGLSKFYTKNLHLFQLYSGVRVSEGLALKWEDIDYFNEKIIISKTVTRINEKKFVIGAAKSTAGNREIPLTETLKKLLKDQRHNLYVMFGNYPKLSDLVFPTTKGTLNTESNINSMLRKAAEVAGIDHVSSHCFRDTYATKAAYSGMNRHTLAEIMGHSNPSITDQFYITVPEVAKQTEANAVQFSFDKVAAQ